MKITISDSGADYIISHLNNNGYEAYLVGGCVRNAILKRPISDYDVATSALPEEVCNLFSHLQILTIGIKHGTVSICLNSKVYEVTTFRKDGEYDGHRWPQRVDFCTDVHTDLARRDFTINAMAYNKNVGIIDDFNGIYDCAKSILRAVNNPFLRFEEDALRILRAMRFASVYSLSIEKNTALAMKEKFNLLTNVSAERVLSEFSKCLMGENADAVLKEFSKIVCFIFPELKSVNDINKVFSAISLVDDLTQKFAILFSQCADQVKKICKRLKFTNLMRDEITLILSKIDFCSYDNPIEIKYLMKDLNNTVFSLINVKYSLAITSNDKILQNNLNKMRNICKQIINENQCYNLAQLALKGDHLLKYSITGEDLKKKLNFALDGVICGKVGNNTQEILNYLGLCDYE